MIRAKYLRYAERRKLRAYNYSPMIESVIVRLIPSEIKHNHRVIEYLYFKDEKKKHKCRCGFVGSLDEFNKNWFDNNLWSSLAGRAGWEYHCPKCGEFMTQKVVRYN